MPISKIDIDNKRFGRTFRGYDPREVDAFLQEVSEEMGDLSDERQRLQESVARLENLLDEHKQREQTLRDTLMTTQKMIDQLKANARKEAQLIIDEAQARAEDMLNQSHLRLAQIHDDIVELKRQRTQFEVKLKSLLDAHQKMLELESREQEELDSMESKLKFFKKAT
ncbi:DivIVA domain-containing protein [Alkalidesulfovibrio alkalitolerans DSM 16529]|jgi:cell division initiation protein|uniref:DivIVA domain-containing protein n=1 Tax=Alkalidesulfovibrio alkalitolerans DSM 16529 TaxID=1121439 RepID=S7T3D8_9BACT|nr:DivIVA domain-containing protein [Alkalidesulfovibrio alkalitolerans]EPR31607.1 DivIVA domain-containing protein [Alkalidesulfovibrio alkalitolerans DSM 16529]